MCFTDNEPHNSRPCKVVESGYLIEALHDPNGLICPMVDTKIEDILKLLERCHCKHEVEAGNTQCHERQSQDYAIPPALVLSHAMRRIE